MQHAQHPPGYTYGSSGQLSGSETMPWLSGQALTRNDGAWQLPAIWWWTTVWWQQYAGPHGRIPKRTVRKHVHPRIERSALQQRKYGKVERTASNGKAGGHGKLLWSEGRDDTELISPRRTGRMRGRASSHIPSDRVHACGYARWEQRSRKE